jgi:hypothetical protein
VNLKALLVCDDVRIEADGTLTLIGVFNERLIAPPGDGPIVAAHLAVVVVIAGLTGADSVGFALRIHHVEEERPVLGALVAETHAPAHDEHNFVTSHTPMIFPYPGPYEIIADVEAGGQRAAYRYRFHVERRPRPNDP